MQDIPEDILKNITGQIRQIMPVPRRLDEFSPEERAQFPRLFEWYVHTQIDTDVLFYPILYFEVIIISRFATEIFYL